MTLTPEDKNKRLEILKQEEKVISEMNDNSELVKHLNEIKKKHNETFDTEDISTDDVPLKIALPENNNSI